MSEVEVVDKLKRVYNKCKVCDANCMLYADDENGIREFFCAKHHPESKRKRSERQKRYYHTEKGLESYTKSYLKKKEERERIKTNNLV